MKNFCDVPNEMETFWTNSKKHGGHRVNFSGKENRYEQGVDFLLHYYTIDCVIERRGAISGRIKTVRLMKRNAQEPM